MPRVVFLRHGHSLSQMQRGLVTGRSSEFPLSGEGRKQANQVATKLETLKIEKMFSSPCLRAVETSDLVSTHLGMSYVINEALTERSHGEFEKKPKEEVYTPETIKAIHSDQYRWAPPGGESLEDVGRRLTVFLRTLHAVEDDHCYLCVTHLMLLWAVFYLSTRCDHSVLPRLVVENCGMVEIVFDDSDSFRLMRWNQG